MFLRKQMYSTPEYPNNLLRRGKDKHFQRIKGKAKNHTSSFSVSLLRLSISVYPSTHLLSILKI